MHSRSWRGTYRPLGRREDRFATRELAREFASDFFHITDSHQEMIFQTTRTSLYFHNRSRIANQLLAYSLECSLEKLNGTFLGRELLRTARPKIAVLASLRSIN